jgi:hypothetical protein
VTILSIHHDNHRHSEVYESILKLNRTAAETFLDCYEKISPTLSESELAAWVKISHTLATSGWHGWQSASAYMKFVASNAGHFDTYNLIDRGYYGLSLGKTSQQPTLAYFDGLARVIINTQINLIEILEQCGEKIQGQYPQASNLMVSYFETAFLVLKNNSHLGFQSWTEIVTQLFQYDRRQIQDFIQVSGKYPNNNWKFVSSIYLRNTLFSHAYISAYKDLEILIVGVEKEFEKMIVDTINTEGGDWVSELIQQDLTKPEIQLFVCLLKDVTQASLISALIETIKRLPLGSSDKLCEWAQVGHSMAEVNSLGAIAFFKLESKGSVKLLGQLLGWLRLEDTKRVLQLYSQCISQYPLEILETKANEASTDGFSICLPELVKVYPVYVNNFRWLKIALHHQIAYFEFGTHDFRFEKSTHPFRTFYRSFDNPLLAQLLFEILEASRIDWRLEHTFSGLIPDIRKIKTDTKHKEFANRNDNLMERITQYSLGMAGEDARESSNLMYVSITHLLSQLKFPTSSVFDTAEIVKACYALIEDSEPNIDSYKPVLYRGKRNWDSAVQCALIELEFDVESDEDIEKGLALLAAGLPENAEIDTFVRGKVPPSKSQEIMDASIDGQSESREKIDSELANWRGQAKASKAKESVYKYDEWDYQIGDYRNTWCTLYEVDASMLDADYVADTKAELSSVAREVKKQLNKLRPELRRKVKGVSEGEDVDLDRTIEMMLDKRSGFSPSENIYIQSQKKQRDVAALFLIDLSASTDDFIENTGGQHGGENRKKIIDLEKQAVILMAEGLENLGDRYAVCGFSGYGRERVDFVVCKNFDDVYGHTVESKIGGLKPLRSTRMGPAIRHSGKMLLATDAKVKALIIISDGYPQDFDYGSDRSSKTYGIRDTTKALLEMSDAGVQSFCLTVDPSGHDYLRDMCPEKQYMVIQDINQLPTELSKIYRGLTS